MNIDRDLLQFYQYKHLLTKKNMLSILSEANRIGIDVRDYISRKEILTETEELPGIGEYYTMPYVQMDMLEVDQELFNMFSFDFMKKHKVIPIAYDKFGTLIIACGKPLDVFSSSIMASKFNCKFDYILVPTNEIDRYIDSIIATLTTTSAVTDLNKERDDALFAAGGKMDGPVVKEEEDAINNTSVKLVDSLIREAIPYRASDIHIEPFEKIVKVRYRIDGELQTRAEFPIDSYPSISARLKIISGLNIAERRLPQDGRINMTVSDKEYDFRVSTLPTVYGEKFVIRILDKTAFNFSRTELGFTEDENVVIDKMLTKPHGIILLTGPTGCGKSTTLYSFLKEKNKPNVNIITVEDPVEYTMPGINQTQVNSKIDMTFAAALRSILRQDPDIIMIGEIRDEETASIAVRAAITGHLVFSTLHTNDAPGAITRLEDMKIPDYLVADAMIGVIAQRLVKRLCPVCKKRYKTSTAEMKILGLKEPRTIYKACGCQFCNNTGYKGRTAVHEIMYMNEDMRLTVETEKNQEVIRKQAKKNGTITLFDACKKLVIDGETDIQELVSLDVE